jgi:hypothetical protein
MLSEALLEPPLEPERSAANADSDAASAALPLLPSGNADEDAGAEPPSAAAAEAPVELSPDVSLSTWVASSLPLLMFFAILALSCARGDAGYAYLHREPFQKAFPVLRLLTIVSMAALCWAWVLRVVRQRRLAIERLLDTDPAAALSVDAAQRIGAAVSSLTAALWLGFAIADDSRLGQFAPRRRGLRHLARQLGEVHAQHGQHLVDARQRQVALGEDAFDAALGQAQLAALALASASGECHPNRGSCCFFLVRRCTFFFPKWGC